MTIERRVRVLTVAVAALAVALCVAVVLLLVPSEEEPMPASEPTATPSPLDVTSDHWETALDECWLDHPDATHAVITFDRPDVDTVQFSTTCYAG
jgi:hypothetical protein